MDPGLEGKSVLVTGGSKGIGRATAEAFAREGAGLIHLTARTAPQLDETARAIESAHGCTVNTWPLGLTDAAADALASIVRRAAIPPARPPPQARSPCSG